MPPEASERAETAAPYLERHRQNPRNLSLLRARRRGWTCRRGLKALQLEVDEDGTIRERPRLDFRAIATRFEKTARNYLSLLQLACSMIWLRDHSGAREKLGTAPSALRVRSAQPSRG